MVMDKNVSGASQHSEKWCNPSLPELTDPKLICKEIIYTLSVCANIFSSQLREDFSLQMGANGSEGFCRLGLHRTSCTEPFYILFLCFLHSKSSLQLL